MALIKDLELFKSSLCQIMIKKEPKDFISFVENEDLIMDFYNNKDYFNALYTLALIDYISKKEEVSINSKYDELRRLKLSETIYPKDVYLLDQLYKERNIKREALKRAIPEFLKYNIVEVDPYDYA